MSCSYWFTHQRLGLNDYYENEYSLLMQDFETDQVLFHEPYQKRRAEYQAALIRSVAESMHYGRLLELGAGKGLTAFHIKRSMKLESLSLHDPGASRYLDVWNGEIKPTSTMSSLEELNAVDFDFAFTFFSLEHTESPLVDMERIAESMKEGAVFLGAVPWLAANPGDLLVGDHCSHFTYVSLGNLLQRNLRVQGMEYRIIMNFPLRALFYVCSRSISRLESTIAALISGPFAPDFADHQELSEPTDIDLFDLAQQYWVVDADISGEKREVLWGAGFYSKLIMLRHHARRFDTCVDSNPSLVGTNFTDPSGRVLEVFSCEAWLKNASGEDRLWLGVSPAARDTLLKVNHTILTDAGVEIAF